MNSKNSKASNSGERRGFALLTVIMLTLGMAALAASAVYLAGNAGLLATSSDREREFKYAAEAALAIGKSRLNSDPLLLPDTGYKTLMSGQAVIGADGVALPGVTANLYVGLTGDTTGQFGRFASVVAEARDATGARFVRRLELTQESFAKFAYWSNVEKNPSGSTVQFGWGDAIWGPVWSNDVILINASGASFHGDVGTARTITGAQYGVFDKGYKINQPAIVLPTNAMLSKLKGYAGSLARPAPNGNNGDGSTVLLRLEFVAVDLGTGGTDSTGADEGFVKIYQANTGQSKWVRGDWQSTKANATTCGASYKVDAAGNMKFFSAAVHGTAWMQAFLVAGGLSSAAATTIGSYSLNQIMSQANARCYLGGDSRLVAEERDSISFTAAQKQIGGDTATFTPNGVHGHWLPYPGVVDARLLARRPADAAYMFPLHRALNPGIKGAIAVAGTVGISGVLRGRVTLYATGSVVILDDQRYATDPSVAGATRTSTCPDVLGIIAGNDIWVADNALQDPPNTGTYKNLDDTKDAFIHATMMALNTAFQVENPGSGSKIGNCQGVTAGRSCLNVAGGIIQAKRGSVGSASGEGYSKQYSYDRCAVESPPPYFPTTGRFLDNRYYEIDPARFNITSLFAGLSSN